MVSKPCFLSFSTQNHAESSGNYLKKSVLDPKCANLMKANFPLNLLMENCVFQLLHAKPCRIIWKLLQQISFGPEMCEIGRNSDFGHVRNYCWLNRLRNTQGKTYGTYLRNIYGRYEEYIKNIHKCSRSKIIRTTIPIGRPLH